MKIGILTFHHSLNCGAALQAWALQLALRQQGFLAEIVNYGMIGWSSKYSVCLDSVRHILGSAYRCVRTFFRSFIIEDYRRRLYRSFHLNYMELGRPVAKNKINTLGYTHLVTGSDQVWHPMINEGDDTYFLANVSDGVKRISYAPSFGVDKFDEGLEKKMAEWLGSFDSISVREPNGASIVKRLCGREAEVVCDPTLLLTKIDYEAIEHRPAFSLPSKYIAVYTICGHPWAESAAVVLGREMNVPVVHLVGGQLAHWHLPGQASRVTAMGPSEFVWFIHHADFVVTNSFHGTVFSLLFHRPLFVALNGKSSDERMSHLLAEVGCGQYCSPLRPEINCRPKVDWLYVDKAVLSLRKRGLEFLKGALA